MTEYMQIDPRILEHPKFLRAARDGGSEAIHLWLGIRAWQELHDYETLPIDLIDAVPGPKRGRDRAVEVLIAVRLLDRDENGFTIHGLEDWISAIGSSARRRHERERKRFYRAKRGSVPDIVPDMSRTVPEACPGQVPEIVPPRSDKIRSDQTPPPSLRSGHPPQSVPDTDAPTPAPVEAPPEPSRAEPRAKPRRRLPGDFAPSPEHRVQAAQLGLDLDSEFRQFRDHAEANGRVAASWPAAFRVWLAKAAEFRARAGGGRGARRGPPQPNSGFDFSQFEAIPEEWAAGSNRHQERAEPPDGPTPDPRPKNAPRANVARAIGHPKADRAERTGTQGRLV